MFEAPGMHPEFITCEGADLEAIYNLWWILNSVF